LIKMAQWIKATGFGAKNAGIVLAATTLLSQAVQAIFTIALAGVLFILGSQQSGAFDPVGTVEGLVAAPIIGFVEGIVAAWLFTIFSKYEIIGGFDVYVDDCQTGWPQKAAAKQWVKLRLQGAYNSAKIVGAYAFVAGNIAGILAAALILLNGISNGIQPVTIEFIIAAIILGPVLFGMGGFLLGAAVAALFNFVRQTSLVDGQDLLVSAPVSAGNGKPAGSAWAKILRIGAINNAKFSGLLFLIIGVVAGIILSIVVYSDMGASAIFVLVGVPLALGLIGVLAGLMQAVIVNFTLGQGFVNGFDVLILNAGTAAGARTTHYENKPTSSAVKPAGKKKGVKKS
jgi:hypothetical protein